MQQDKTVLVVATECYSLSAVCHLIMLVNEIPFKVIFLKFCIGCSV